MLFDVETDHKPLVTRLSSKKNLDELTPRIQRFHMRLMKYTYTIAHVPGKELVTADALSRAPHRTTDDVGVAFHRRGDSSRHRRLN